MPSAFVFLTCGANQIATVQNQVKQIHGVLDAKLTTGTYDLILRVQGDDHEKLMQVVGTIKLLAGVKLALTNIIQNPESK